MKIPSAVILCCALALAAAPAKKSDPRELELAALKSRLAGLQDSLDAAIASRWEAKQRYLAQRETDKEEASQAREAQERAYRELSRVKEECFARERMLEQAAADLERKKDEGRFTVAAVEEALGKQADAVLEAFPLDYEERRMAVETVRRGLQEKLGALTAIDALVKYKLGFIRRASRLAIGKQAIIPDREDAVQVTVARFGTVFAYALSADNNAYFVRQTGQLGRQRFAIERIGAADLIRHLQSLFPRWVETGNVDGVVMVDVLQNAQSRILVSGEQAKPAARALAWLRAGGPVMIPLLALPFWALAIVALKLIQFGRRYGQGRNRGSQIIMLLEHGERSKAGELAGATAGPVGRLCAACFKHAAEGREAAEKAIREILADEIPRLNSHLNTLAVIAGVAPLLGLLGTVTGMINLFEVITNYGTGDPKLMAAGISEALVTTEAGLIIAIPVLLLHNYLRNRKNRIHAEIERLAITVLNRLWPSKDGEKLE